MNSKIGIFSWYGFVLPFEERIAQIREAGFETTTLWWEDEGPPHPFKKSDMPRLVREAGLCPENLHAPFNDSDALWSEDEGARKAVVCQHLDWLLDWTKVSRAFPGTYHGALTLEVCPAEKEREAAPHDFLKLAHQRISAVKAQIVTIDRQSHSQNRGSEEVMK